FPSASSEESREFVVAHAAHDRGISYLVTVQVEDRQHGAIVHRIEEFVNVPTGREGTSLRFAVADYARDQQIRVVECCAASVAERVAEFSTFVNGSRCFRCVVAGNAARKRELLEQPLHPFFTLLNIGVEL